MKILAIESSGLAASAAIVTEDKVVAQYSVNFKKTHSQTLLPMIDEIVKMTETELEELDALAVTMGPGSFTGLRIGAATVKGLGLALNLPVVEIPTVDAMAYNITGTDMLVCPMMDAKRSQVYTGLYEFEKDELKVVKEQMAVAVEDILALVNEQGRGVIFLGDGAESYKEKIEELVKVPYMFAPVHMMHQNAAATGALAIKYFKEGRYVSAADHVPVYLRLSQAEREKAEREKRQ